MPPPGRHPGRSDHKAHGSAASGCAWQPCIARVGVVALCPPGCWPSLACPRAYPHPRARPKAGPSPSSGFRRLHRYYEPLGLPLGTTPLRTRLIGAAFARREPPRRVSPVPHQAVPTCPLPYPGGVLCHSIPRHSLLPSPRHDRLGHPSLSVVSLTRLQSSRFRIGPAGSLPSHEAVQPRQGFRRSAQTGGFRPRARSLLRGARRLPRRDLHPLV